MVFIGVVTGRRRGHDVPGRVGREELRFDWVRTGLSKGRVFPGVVPRTRYSREIRYPRDRSLHSDLDVDLARDCNLGGTQVTEREKGRVTLVVFQSGPPSPERRWRRE